MDSTTFKTQSDQSNKKSIKLTHSYYWLSRNISNINMYIWSRIPILYDVYMQLSLYIFSPIDQWFISVFVWMDDTYINSNRKK